jgi:hypothetical protein
MSNQVTATTSKAAVVWPLFMSATLAIAVPACSVGTKRDSPSPAQASGDTQEESGLRGRTIVTVGSGAEDGGASRRILSMGFAVVPIDGETTNFSAAKYVTSDPDGTFRVVLAPGKYRIVSKEKALNPESFRNIRRRLPLVVVEKTVFVHAGAFTDVDVVHSGEAP